MKAKLSKKAIKIKEELFSQIPNKIFNNEDLELRVERLDTEKVHINFYVGGPDNYVGYIGIENGQKVAIYNDSQCAESHKSTLRCKYASLCTKVQKFLISYMEKNNTSPFA
ncbi:MAG: hypothetical protein NTY99_00860 [DPANN group archaeon]|nr:hypothetical protein [DPANN group archaeon]